MRPLSLLLVAALLPWILGVPAADATGRGPSPTRYRPPVDRPVVDPFRAPAHPYGPGNRGLEYDTVPGDPVQAIGDGTVVFAGVVARQRYVTVLHPDGLRSSYSYLGTILVGVGDRVVAGAAIGTAGERLHLGVRRGRAYLDPARLFGVRRAVLVPVPTLRPRSG
jgi:murein DD-endopeptidase MepM/ murein hydrolase activator NlpD